MYRFSGSPVENRVPLLVPVSFTAVMLTWWTFASGSMGVLIDMLQSGFRMDYFIDTPIEFRVISMPFGEEVFINLGMFLFFAFALIGIFYMISRRGNSSAFALAWAGMAPLAIGFSSLTLGLAVIEHRWWYIAQILRVSRRRLQFTWWDDRSKAPGLVATWSLELLSSWGASWS